MIIYIQDKQVKIQMKQSSSSELVTIKSNPIINQRTSSFSVVLSTRYISIIDLISNEMISDVIRNPVKTTTKKSLTEHITLGYNAKLASYIKAPKNFENEDESIGCIEEFLVNSETIYFDDSAQKHGTSDGYCSFQKMISEPEDNMVGDQAPNHKARICGEQKLQTVYDEDNNCPTTREYNVVSDCPPTCRNQIPNNVDGTLVADGPPLCCKVTRYRKYNLRFQCKNKPPYSKKQNVFKKCECTPC